jgi:tripartite-type tricarboxylate transporter receptor subunit TctC
VRRRTLLAALAASPQAQAQTWPSGPIRIVVPYAPGGPADLVARSIGSKLGEALGVPVAIESRDGAGGNIGTALVARAAPDGQTLLLGTNGPLVVNPSLMASIPFDPIADFAPITYLADVPLYLAVPAALPATSLAQLLAMAKAAPGSVSYASSGIGSGGHLAGALLGQMSGAPLTHVAYRGAAPATTDLVGGRVQMLFVGLPVVQQHVLAGRLRLLAVATPRRTGNAPEVPTVAEAAGLPGFSIASWYGLLAPAGTPRAIIERLHAEATRALAAHEVRDLLYTRNGLEPNGAGPDAFAAAIAQEIPEYRRIVRLAGAHQE